MKPQLASLAAAQGGVFSRAQAIAGRHTPAEIRHRLSTGHWVVVRHGVHAERTVWEAAQKESHAQHAVDIAAALLGQPVGVTASHTSAARLYRVRYVGGWPVRPTLTAPVDRRCLRPKRTRTLDRRVAKLPKAHVTAVDGVAATAPARTLVAVARELPFAEGVVVADQMRPLIPDADLDEVLQFCSRWPGIEVARNVVAFADPRAESPLESYGRAVLCEHGVVGLEPQVWLYDDRGLIGRVDGYLADFFTVVEFDGLVKYDTSGSLRAEKVRQERLEDAGFGVARATHQQLERQPGRTAERVRAVCRRTLRRRADARTGELTGRVGPPPDWWSGR